MNDIKGYEGLYAITEDGQVWNHRLKRFMKQLTDKDGYKFISLSKDAKSKQYFVHRLVAQAYIDNPDNLPLVNHKDEVKDNNCVENLEWCTNKYNINYGTAIQRRAAKRKNVPITAEQRLKISQNSSSKKAVYCVELDKVFDSITEAITATGARQLNACLAGRQKTAGGYHWRYMK